MFLLDLQILFLDALTFQILPFIHVKQKKNNLIYFTYNLLFQTKTVKETI